MARPLVIVFQELAAPQATPSIPDLNTVIVGPSYDLLDYPDDAASIQLSQTYGQVDKTAGNGTMMTVKAKSLEALAAFHAAGLANGGTDEGQPGERPAGSGTHYAYVRDPDGNKICASC